MLTILWSDKFSIDVPEIDEQHKRLFTLIAHVNKALSVSDTENIISDALKELLDYTKYHFTIEEAIMLKEDYSRYNQHKSEHEKLTEQVIDFMENPDTCSELPEFLFNWLTKHIMNQDKKIGTFIHMKKNYSQFSEKQ